MAGPAGWNQQEPNLRERGTEYGSEWGKATGVSTDTHLER